MQYIDPALARNERIFPGLSSAASDPIGAEGQSHLVTAIVVADDDLSQIATALTALSKQVGVRVEYKFLFVGLHKSTIFRNIVENHFPGSEIVVSGPANQTERLNAIVEGSAGAYVTFVANGDIYRADRLSTLVAEAKYREAGLLFSHAHLVDFKGQTISSEHNVYRQYTHALLKNIEVCPSVSFLLLWDDVLLSPGNLFFSKDLFRKVGGFRDFRRLYAFDFLLRAARIEEPHIIRRELISCRPSFLGRRLEISQDIDDERVEILSSHLLELLASPPENANCDVFRAHAFMFAGVAWSQTLADAVDGWVETRIAIEGEREAVKPIVAKTLSGKHFRLLTHELSLSGAPVIVMEMASLLIAQGAKVTVTSPTDGPLRASFEQRGISVVMASRGNPRILKMEAKLPAYKAKGTFKWLYKRLKYRLYKAVDEASRKRAKTLVGTQNEFMLVNSVAAWEWVEEYLIHSQLKIVWFIHETFDPKWLATAVADKLFRESIAAGILTMIFGSEATARTWALEGYPGHVRYWSGIASDKYPGDQFTAVAPTQGKRVLLNVGSTGTRKGTRNLLEAFAWGRKTGVIGEDVELRIVGAQPPSSKQETRDIVFRARQLDLRDCVRIIGLLKPEAIDSFYDEADIYVHSSYFDCMPIAILTAMARGMPIVATDVDGCGEAIIDGETGMLAPPRSPRHLAVAIGKLLDDSELREKVARGARDIFVRKFSVEATFDRVRQVLDAETHALVTGRAAETGSASEPRLRGSRANAAQQSG